MTTAITAQLTTGIISTKPERDPYANIDGVVSKTMLKLDPRDMTVWVEQGYNDNATPSDEWHGLILTWAVPNHPSELAMLRWIDDNMDSLTAICDGYEAVWDGSNHIGRLTGQARAIQTGIEFALNNNGGPAEYYQWWTVESWLELALDHITAGMTDEDLAEFASGAEPGPGDVIIGDILEYITKRRDNLRADAE